jgi:hypothetical protein
MSLGLPVPLRILILAAGFRTSKDMFDAAGVTKQCVYAGWSTGRRRPRRATIAKIAKALRVSPEIVAATIPTTAPRGAAEAPERNQAADEPVARYPKRSERWAILAERARGEAGRG